MVCYVRVVEVCQGSYIENSDGKSLWDPVAILSIVAVHLNLTEWRSIFELSSHTFIILVDPNAGKKAARRAAAAL